MMRAAAKIVNVITFIVLLLTSCDGYVECDIKPPQTSPSHFYGHANTAMSNELGKYKATQYECMKLCRKDARCLAFTYAVDTHKCATFDRDSVTGPQYMKTVSGVWFYDMRRKRKYFTRSYLGACQAKNKCVNGGSCINDCSELGYTCACPVQFYGKFCQNKFVNGYVFKTNIVKPSGSNTAFTYKNKHYLVVGGVNGSPTNAYRYNDTNERYEYYQQLTGKSDAKQIEHFIINGQLYVFVINYKIDEKKNIDSYIYIFDSRTGFFDQHQTIDTWSGHDASYLELNSNHYLLVVDYREQQSVVNSTVYKWNFTNNQFVEYVKIPVHGAKSGKLFSMDGVLYAAIANYFTTTNDYTIKSHLWKLKQSGVTELVQSLDESDVGSCGIDTFAIDGDTYLVVVNRLDCAQNTIVYCWDKSSEEFKIHQRIPVDHCPSRSTIFKVGGEVFMVITTTRTKWDTSDNNDNIYTTSSPIFKLEGTMFVTYGAMTSHVCNDITFFEQDGEYFLSQSNHRNNNNSMVNPKLNIYQWV